jgi:hypothetical protein
MQTVAEKSGNATQMTKLSHYYTAVLEATVSVLLSVFVPDDIAALDICIVSAMTDTTVWTTTKTHMYF